MVDRRKRAELERSSDHSRGLGVVLLPEASPFTTPGDWKPAVSHRIDTLALPIVNDVQPRRRLRRRFLSALILCPEGVPRRSGSLEAVRVSTSLLLLL